MKASLEAGRVVKLPSVNTIADGTAVTIPREKLAAARAYYDFDSDKKTLNTETE